MDRFAINVSALRCLTFFFNAGKLGIGGRKRPLSPVSTDRVAKAAKVAEDACHDAFRGRNREEYEERRAEARLESAQRTCLALDEKAGKPVSLQGFERVIDGHDWC